MKTTTITHSDGTKTVIKQSRGGLGCLGWLAVLVVIGSCMQLPILILPTVVILGAGLYAKAKQS